MTVAICTRDRAGSLDATLATLARARAPADWELVIVDNGSTDRTPAVVAAYHGRLPIVAVSEPRAGLSHARNRAVEAAQGDHVVWLDDDVNVSPDALVAYEAAFAAWPEAAVFGGPIRPRLEGAPPAWLTEALPDVEAAYAARQAPADGRVTAESPPFGANYAVRMIEQRRQAYDPALGRRPGRVLISGEETELLRRILAMGGQGRWVAQAAVEHRIPAERQTVAYLRSYFFGYGWTNVVEAGTARPAWLRPGHLIAVCLSSEARYRLARLRRRTAEWAPAMVMASTLWGRLAAVMAGWR